MRAFPPVSVQFVPAVEQQYDAGLGGGGAKIRVRQAGERRALQDGSKQRVVFGRPIAERHNKRRAIAENSRSGNR